ncbi:hypothetical protein TRFO_08765 [Tritrichomonas foetus]|uniref:C2H2-type domain-containing protein n=1 Tax=Tritrichomonas foetus TaxID=1144522 RepID=A0A1J4JK44_9EUKA|nr:hypothetical protein TRFO_08765 [Tritrichomonas foetus]|eukprot:OHS98751.1 hypothetical protein TRFO_08765 [Tritrichomonas foetus]
MFDPLPESFFRSPVGLDWNFIAAVDSSALLLSRDKATMEIIIEDFLRTTSFEGLSQELSSKFLGILQVIVKTMKQSNQRLKRKLKEEMKANERLHNRIDKIKNKPCNVIGVSCPVCQKGFVAIKFLDLHIFTHHADLSVIWQTMRTPHYTGLTQSGDPFQTESKLKQTIETIGDQFLLDQKSSEMRLQNFFRKKLMKVNNKIDQYTESSTQNSPQSHKSHSPQSKNSNSSFNQIQNHTNVSNTPNNINVINPNNNKSNDNYNNNQNNFPLISRFNTVDNNQNNNGVNAQRNKPVFLDEEEEEGEITISKANFGKFNNSRLNESTNVFVISDSSPQSDSPKKNVHEVVTVSDSNGISSSNHSFQQSWRPGESIKNMNNNPTNKLGTITEENSEEMNRFNQKNNQFNQEFYLETDELSNNGSDFF